MEDTWTLSRQSQQEKGVFLVLLILNSLNRNVLFVMF